MEPRRIERRSMLRKSIVLPLNDDPKMGKQHKLNRVGGGATLVALMQRLPVKLVLLTGIEPARISPRDSKSRASTSSATLAF